MSNGNKDVQSLTLFPPDPEDDKGKGSGEERVGPYIRGEVISAWIKEMRLGNVEAALYWLQVMTDLMEVDQGYLMYRLAIFAFEDAFDPEFASYVAAGITCCTVTRRKWQPGGDTNIPFALTEAACRARKFWECEEGRERERASWRILEQFDAKKYRKMPAYAVDVHTKRGKAMGGGDARFSGDDEGRMHMCRMFEKLGRLDPEHPWIPEDDN